MSFVPNALAGAKFREYVIATSRPEAIAKRSALVGALNEQKHLTIRTLVDAVEGNTGDRAWVSQAMKDGWIGRGAGGGKLCLGCPLTSSADRAELEELTEEWLACWERMSAVEDDRPAELIAALALRGPPSRLADLVGAQPAWFGLPARAVAAPATDHYGQPLPTVVMPMCNACGAQWWPGCEPALSSCRACRAERQRIQLHYGKELDGPDDADQGAGEEIEDDA